MTERVVSIKLVADATGLTQSFNRASDAAQGLRDKANSASRSLADSARNNREAWATVGAGLTAVGVAVTGIGVAALRTGVQYNTLQQTTRAALTTLLGSATAANAQMDKLDDFARNSPFAKQTFITAQQQMLGFGIETQKVLPYLDAVQNAVAAMGGNNQQIGELSYIMAQISASSKITAQDLHQFGQRGVDAADLIGSQMGKTGAQIRADITDGALDAQVALDALAAGMAERFGGAAANVKNTFEGAMDRVKAAWRDFASELAKPLVDPNGGGALVDLLNWTADAMRNFEALPEPVKNTASSLTMLAGATALAGGAFMLALPKMLEFKSALADLGVTTAALRSGIMLGGLITALALAAHAMNDWVVHATGARQTADDLAKSLSNTRDAAQTLEGALAGSAFAKWSNETARANASLQQLNNDFGSFIADMQGTWFGELVNFSSGGFGFLGNEAANAKKNIVELDRALAEMVTAGQTDAAAVSFAEFSGMAREAGWSVQRITEAFPEYLAAVEATEHGTGGVTAATEDFAEEIENANELLDKLRDALRAVAGEALSMGEAQDKAMSAINKLSSAAEEEEAALYGTNDASIKLRDSIREVETSHRDAAAAIIENDGTLTDAIDTWRAGREAVIEQRIAMGESREEATLWAEKNLGSAKEVERGLRDVSRAAKDIPKDIETRIRLQGWEDAMTQLQQLSRERVVGVRVQSDYGSGSWFAGGGTVGYAGGGTIAQQATGTIARAATGLTIGGIGGGVSGGTVYGAGTAKSDSVLVRLSKGEEVTQEPYASANRGLLKAINRGDFHQGMLQPQVIVQGGGGATQVSLAGATLKASIDGRPIDIMIHDQVVKAFSGGSQSALNQHLGLPRR